MRIQREGAQLQPRGMRSAGPGDDQARFLADLRALRDRAAIGYDELAARAHYPSDILKEAENGPYLPTLPILAAYVRACEGDVLEWEERWRRVANEAAGDPGLPIRPPGASPAAVAGARAGIGVVSPDAYDPERIKAALRGAQRSGQSSRSAGTPGIAASAARGTGSGGTGWSFADAGSTGWNTVEAAAGWDATGEALDTAATPPAGWDTMDAGLGLNTVEAPAAGWTAATDGAAAGWAATDAAVPEWSATDAAAGWNATDAAGPGWSATDGAAESWGTRDGGANSAGWRSSWDTAVDQAPANGNHETKQRNGSFGAVDREGQSAESWSQDSELGQQGSESAWSGLTEAEQEPWSPGIEASPPESASGELVWPELADAELTQGADGERLAHPDLSGGELGWAEVPTADVALTREMGQEAAAEPPAWNDAHQALPRGPAIPEVSGHAQIRSESQARSIPPQMVAPEAKEHSADRLYPLRLLVIIVIAALIGSGLVLLLK
jgi:hypothetical protein